MITTQNLFLRVREMPVLSCPLTVVSGLPGKVLEGIRARRSASPGACLQGLLVQLVVIGPAAPAAARSRAGL